MESKRWHLEISLYALALSLALFLRFYHLGIHPMSDAEATWALQALRFLSPDSGWVMGNQATYVSLTGFTMALFGSNELWARIWPALSGATLAFLPWFYRQQLGRPAAIFLAFALALDPGLVTISRQAGSPILAFALLLWGVTLLKQNSPLLAGLALSAALLSGPAVYLGLVSLGLAAGIAFRLGRVEAGMISWLPPVSRQFWLSLGIAALVGWAVQGSAFFFNPQGLAAPFSALAESLKGWLTPGAIPALRVAGALVGYELFPLVFALVGLTRWVFQYFSGQERPDEPLPVAGRKFFLFWALASLLLILLFPGRSVADLAWVVIPLWALACLELQRHLSAERPQWIVYIQVALVFILSSMLWTAMISTGRFLAIPTASWLSLRVFLFAGILLLGALTTFLVALGWSWEASRMGLAWGLASALLFYSLSAMWGASQVRANQPVELWTAPPGAGQAQLFRHTLDDLARWSTGMPGFLQIVSTVDTPALRWALRDYESSLFTGEFPSQEQPAIIISRSETPQLAAAYRGQDFVWETFPAWERALPTDFLGWLTFRSAPTQAEKIILWARADLFPGGVWAPGNLSPIPEVEPLENELK